MPLTPMTRDELLDMVKQCENDIGLMCLPLEILQPLCQRLGQSARGTRKELIERIRRQLTQRNR